MRQREAGDPQGADPEKTQKTGSLEPQKTPKAQGVRPQKTQKTQKASLTEEAPAAPASPELADRPTATASRKRASAPKAPGPPRESTPGETPVRILMVASEAQPFSKTGGLADVSSALSRALGRLGHDVTLFTPRYRGVQPGQRRGSVRAFVAGQWYDAELQEVPLGPGARAMLVDCAALYDRAGIYTEHQWDYPDNATRFAFLAIAALDWAAAQPQKPDVLHGHDWQAGLLPVYARETPSVFTIHNIAFRGTSRRSGSLDSDCAGTISTSMALSSGIA